MSQTLVASTTESGYLNSVSGPYNGLQDILGSAYSSSATDYNSPTFFFHSDDATTGIPGTAIIDSVYFHYYIRSIIKPIDWAELDWGIFISNTGYSGSTLAGANNADYGNYGPPYFYVGFFDGSVLTTGWQIQDVSLAGINRGGNGYTNIQIVPINVNSAGPEYWEVDIFGDDGSHTGNISYLEVNWHLPIVYGASQAQILMGK